MRFRMVDSISHHDNALGRKDLTSKIASTGSLSNLQSLPRRGLLSGPARASQEM